MKLTQAAAGIALAVAAVALAIALAVVATPTPAAPGTPTPGDTGYHGNSVTRPAIFSGYVQAITGTDGGGA